MIKILTFLLGDKEEQKTGDLETSGTGSTTSSVQGSGSSSTLSKRSGLPEGWGFPSARVGFLSITYFLAFLKKGRRALKEAGRASV